MNYSITIECFDENDNYIFEEYNLEDGENELFIEERCSSNEKKLMLISIFENHFKDLIPKNTKKVIIHSDNEQVSFEYDIYIE